MRYFYLIFFSVFIISEVYSQDSSFRVAGIIKEKGTNIPIPYASISIINSRTGKFQDLNSDSSGIFQISLGFQIYKLIITSVGYDSLIQTIQPKNNLDTINFFMDKQTATLSTVKVVSSEKQIKNIPGGISYKNLNSIPLPNQSLDLLRQTPGVSIDSYGNVRLNGQTVEIYIDNKKLNLSGEELVNYLKSFPDANVDIIEALSVPPAKYDANGASIIQLISKPSRIMGIYGDVSSSLSTLPSFGTSASINMNLSKFSLQFTGSINGGRSISDQVRNFFSIESPNSIKSNLNAKTNSIYQHYHLDLNYNLSKFDQVGLTIKFNPSTYNKNSNSYIMPKENLIDNRNFYNQGVTRMRNSYTLFDITYNKKHKKNQLLAELNFAPFRGRLINDFVDSSSSYIKNTFNNTFYDFRFYIGKVDYTIFLRENSKLELGIKNSYSKINNDFFSDTLNKNHLIVRDSQISNNLEYNENIFASYITYTGNFKDFGYQMGLRLENSSIGINSLTMSQKHYQYYTNVFPTISFTYQISAKSSFGLDFSKRIQRPGYTLLNPFLNTSNPTYYFKGNPYLEPAIIFQIQAKYLKFWSNSNNTIFTIFGGHAKNLYASFVEKISPTVLLESGKNYLHAKNIGLSVNSQNKLSDWLSLNSGFSFISAKYESNETKTGKFPISNYINCNLFALFNLTPSFKLQLSSKYQSNYRYGQMLFKQNGSIDIGASKQVNNRISVSMTISDILKTDRSSIIIESPTYKNTSSTINNSRSLTIRLRVDFGKRNNDKNDSGRRKTIEENTRDRNL